MHIASITPLPVTVPTERDPLSFCFVRIETDTGLVGYGEACDSYLCSYAEIVAKVIDDAFAPQLLGAELVAVGPLIDRLRLATRRRLGDGWIAAQARSALEIALWDLHGQQLGSSVSALIGRVRDRVPVYASWTFLEEGPAQWHADHLAPWLERGVRMAKVRVGPSWQADIATLTGLRSLLPDVELMVDGSETFTVATARRIADALYDLGVTWFEEPLPQGARAGIRELARHSRVPLAYGEHMYGADEAIAAMAAGELAVLQPDAAVCGGITTARTMALLAGSYGVRVVPHICAGPVALAANLHVAATVPAVAAVEYPLHLVPVWAQLGAGMATGTAAIVDGTVAVPSSPGLGVAVDEVAAAAYPYQGPGTRVVGTATGVLDRFAGQV